MKRAGRCYTLGPLPANAPSQLNILGHDSHALRVDSAQIGVLKQADEIGFGGLLQGEDGGALKAQVGLEVLGDLADETLEGELADEELGRLLELANFTKGDGSRAIAMGLLDTSRGRGRLTSGLGG